MNFTIRAHDCNFRVYAEDTDMMGIVYHANYLRFFERARTEMLREYGISLTMMAAYDTHFAIYNAQIRYLAPARLDDMIKITTSCQLVKASTLEFLQRMYVRDSNLLCEAKIQVVCVNAKLKPKRIPVEHFQALFSI